MPAFLGILYLLAQLLTPASGDCFPHPSYQATAEKYSCQLHQPNWGPETYFEVKYQHCQENLKFGIFIRNFNGIDEINMDLSRLEPSWTTTKFNGEEGNLNLEISVFEANLKFDYEAHIQVKVYIDGQNILTGLFLANDRSGCTWLDTLELHNQALFGVGIFLGLVFLCSFAYCCQNSIRSKLNHSEAGGGELNLMAQDSL